MSSTLKRMLALAAAGSLVAIVMGATVGAQNPPARGMRWTKAAPFPEPEEELYGTVINGKFYVVGGFGFNPGGVPNAALNAGRGGAAATNAAAINAAVINSAPCGGCPPGLIYEYDPGPDKWTKKRDIPVHVHHQAQAAYNGKIYVSGGELQNRQLSAAFRALEAYDPVNDTWEILPSMPSARHGNAAGFIGNKLHQVSGKMEGGGAPDMTAGSPHPYATESHDVLEIPTGTQ